MKRVRAGESHNVVSNLNVREADDASRWNAFLSRRGWEFVCDEWIVLLRCVLSFPLQHGFVRRVLCRRITHVANLQLSKWRHAHVADATPHLTASAARIAWLAVDESRVRRVRLAFLTECLKIACKFLVGH